MNRSRFNGTFPAHRSDMHRSKEKDHYRPTISRLGEPKPGKTIMAGLLIKELIARGDLQRCLIVCPGSLAEQWQDELYRRFHLPFEILTNYKLEAARTGNWFLENNLVIARLDKLSRNEHLQAKLSAPDCRWDLIVCDEAHKMSATYFGGEIKYTKRYKIGQLLSTLT